MRLFNPKKLAKKEELANPAPEPELEETGLAEKDLEADWEGSLKLDEEMNLDQEIPPELPAEEENQELPEAQNLSGDADENSEKENNNLDNSALDVFTFEGLEDIESKGLRERLAEVDIQDLLRESREIARQLKERA